MYGVVTRRLYPALSRHLRTLIATELRAEPHGAADAIIRGDDS
jgi:hypothetical protein